MKQKITYLQIELYKLQKMANYLHVDINANIERIQELLLKLRQQLRQDNLL